MILANTLHLFYWPFRTNSAVNVLNVQKTSSYLMIMTIIAVRNVVRKLQFDYRRQRRKANEFVFYP